MLAGCRRRAPTKPPTPTATATATAMVTASPIPTATTSPTPSRTPTLAPTPTPTATPSPTPIADTIIFSPTATTLTSASTSSNFTIALTAYNSSGGTITPSKSNPFNIHVYGAPDGAIKPIEQKVSKGSATFTYSGKSFPNNITINAWIGDSTAPLDGQQALGQMLVKLSNPPGCAASSATYSVPLTQTLPNDLEVTGAVGYTDAKIPSSSQNTFAIDTGSLGTIVSALPSRSASNTFVIGPGPKGVQCYTSSDNAYFGNYYLTPVDIQVNRPPGTTFVQTTPILVLAVKEYCSVNDCTHLVKSGCTTNFPPFYYLGVGFDRPGATPGNLFHSPAANAFLHVTGAKNGTDIAPGYVLTTGGVTLGVNGTSGYNVINLSPSTTEPGDWQTEQGCYSFPPAPSNQFCGEVLLDVGIEEMFLDAPMAQWPHGLYDPSSYPVNQVPTGTTVNVLMGKPSSPAINYSFKAVETPTSAPTPTGGPAPSYAQWEDSSSTGKISANIGRHPLNCYNYLYQGQCGEVGFQKITPSPTGCSMAN
jgi:hypothetical protein